MSGLVVGEKSGRHATRRTRSGQKYYVYYSPLYNVNVGELGARKLREGMGESRGAGEGS